MLIDDVRKKNIDAMKARDNVAKAVYTLLISDYKNLQMQRGFENKEVSDIDLIQIIQKMIKDLEESKALYIQAGNEQKTADIEKQIALAAALLPKMMSAEEIKAEISNLADKSIGNIMKHFKTNFNGKVDFTLVQKVSKES